MIRSTRSVLLIALLLIGSAWAQPGQHVNYSTVGLDLEILSYGGSLGGFYSFHPRENLSLDLETDWALVESSDTYTYYNYYSQPVTINNRNLSFAKLLAGITWFPFLESMHPSIKVAGFAAAGPLLSLNTADDETFLTRWQDVELDVTPMVRGGVHVKIVNGKGAFYTLRLGYDYASFDRVIDSKQTYKGMFFQVGLEFLHR
jgi:hypothetical protein